ncbi:MAG: hypothetical protein JNM72_14535 [Deltaproteobacteria bacterium]|nr:hypothetical protein [Deltaproteobacteria bacterium]
MPAPLRTRTAALATGLALAACAKEVRPARVPVDDPDRVVRELRGRDLPAGLSAPFRIKVEAPGRGGSTVGGLLIGAPDKVRVDVQTPLRTSLYMVATDGAALHVWDAQASTFYRGDDGVAALAALSQGAVQAVDVVQLLTGGLPLSGAPVLHTGASEEGVLVVLQAPHELLLRASLDARPATVRWLELGQGAPGCASCPLQSVALRLEVSAVQRVGPLALPEELSLHLVPLDMRVSLSFSRWQPTTPVEAAFALQAPPGAVEKGLVQAITEAAARRGRPLPVGQPSAPPLPVGQPSAAPPTEATQPTAPTEPNPPAP